MTYVDKTKINQNTAMWHMRLSHMSYNKLDLIMKKQKINGLPKLEVGKDVCVGCQFCKAHQ